MNNESDLSINLENACRNDFSLELEIKESSLKEQGLLPDFCLAYETLGFEDAYPLIEKCLREKAEKLKEFNPPNCMHLYGVEEITFEAVYQVQLHQAKNYDIKDFDYNKYKKKRRKEGEKSQKELKDLFNCTVFNLILSKRLNDINHDDAKKLLLNVCRQHLKTTHDYCVTFDSEEEKKNSKKQRFKNPNRPNKHYGFQGIVLSYAFIFMPTEDNNTGWANKSALSNGLKDALNSYLINTSYDFRDFSEDNLDRRIKEWFGGELNEAVNAFTVISRGNIAKYMSYFNECVNTLRIHGPDSLRIDLREEPQPDNFNLPKDMHAYQLDHYLLQQNLEKLADWKKQILDSDKPSDLDFLRIVIPTTQDIKKGTKWKIINF
jgi:hypothetical protein